MLKGLRLLWYWGVILGAILVLPGFPLRAEVPEKKVAGETDLGSGLFRFNTLIPQLIQKYGIPGGVLAIMKDGRLVIAKGFGFADLEKKVRARPEILFRIASVSKTITSTAVLKLIEEGKIGLDDKAFKILDNLQPLGNSGVDPRLYEIKVRHLLQHSGGWDSHLVDDPQFAVREIAEILGLPSPVSPQTLIRSWMGQPLQFDPGTKHVYSNFGYNVLGRIIEKVTGQTYQDHVNSTILMPLGVRRMWIGQTLWEQRAKDEATYYAQPGSPLMDAVFPPLGEVPQAYGGWSHPALDAHGGWIASVVDLLRFVRGIEGSGGQQPILSPETIRLIEEDPHLPGGSADSYYGLGWVIGRSGEAITQWSHGGALQNSNAALLVRQANGISYALIFNSLPDDYMGFFTELGKMVKEEIARITFWPSHDLFPKFP